MGSDNESDPNAMPCHECGYDLRGLPAEVERCSECGHPVVESAEAWEREAGPFGVARQLRRATLPILILAGAMLGLIVFAVLVALVPNDFMRMLEIPLTILATVASIGFFVALTVAGWHTRRKATPTGWQFSFLGWFATLAFGAGTAAVTLLMLGEWLGLSYGGYYWSYRLPMMAISSSVYLGAVAYAWRVCSIASAASAPWITVMRISTTMMTIGTIAFLTGVASDLVYLFTGDYFELPPLPQTVINLMALLFVLGLIVCTAMTAGFGHWAKGRVKVATAALAAFKHQPVLSDAVPLEGKGAFFGTPGAS